MEESREKGNREIAGPVKTQSQYAYSKTEEILNCVSHGTGAALALAGSIVMLSFSSGTAEIISVVAYGMSMIFMYSISTAYHATAHPKAKHVLQILDHASIYLLIAGCYSPFILVLLRDSSRAPYMFAALWVIAIVGIYLNIKDITRFKRLHLVLYLLMGWMALLDVRNIFAGIGIAGTVLLFAGGASYTIGVIFYRMKSVKYMHSVWHIFVLAGSILHYICIFRYIVLA